MNQQLTKMFTITTSSSRSFVLGLVFLLLRPSGRILQKHRGVGPIWRDDLSSDDADDGGDVRNLPTVDGRNPAITT